MGDDEERPEPQSDPTVEITTPTHYPTPEGPDVEQVVDDVKDVLNAMNNDEKPKVRRRKRRPKRSPMPGVDPATGLASVGGPPPPPSKPVIEQQPIENTAEFQLGLDEVPNQARGRSTKSSYLKSVGKWAPWRGRSQSGKEVRRYSSRKRRSKNIRSTSAAPKTRGMDAIMEKAGVKTKGGRRGNRDIEVKVDGPPAPPPKIPKGDEDLSPLLVTENAGGKLLLPANLLNDSGKRIFRHKVMCVIVWLITVFGLAGGTGYMTYEASSTSSFARLSLDDSPTARPTRFPIFVPTPSPTHPAPTKLPTKSPTLFPTTPAPTLFPVVVPTPYPTFIPTPFPVVVPTQFPTTDDDDNEEEDD